MIRILALSAALMSASAMSSAAGSKADERCALFGEMSAELADLRKSGTSETDAMMELAEKYSDEPVDVLQVIPVLSSWVFSMNDADLDGDVASAMTSQCKDAA